MQYSDRLLSEFNAVVDSLRTEYARTPAAHSFTFDDVEFQIPAGISCKGFESPDAWIARKHENGNAHEPGMISALLFLRDRLEREDIAILDIGALYGYFSFLAQACFKTAEVHCVEANPHSAAVIAEAIARNTCQSPPVTLHEILMGAEERRQLHLVSGFTIRPFRLLGDLKKIIALESRHLAARLIGRPRPRKHSARYLDEVPVAALLSATRSDRSRPVVKLDTEGFQAVFLPPATPLLIDRAAVLLLEFDRADVMQALGTSNFDLCRPFLRAGYTMLWLVHRVPGQRAQIVTEDSYDPEIERNSLAILLPPDLSTAAEPLPSPEP